MVREKRGNKNQDPANKELEMKLQRLLQIVETGPTTIAEISEDPLMNIPKEDVWPLIDKLRERGHDIVIEKRDVYLRLPPIPKIKPSSLPSITKQNRVEVLFMEGPCFGLKTQQGDLAATCLAIGEERGVFFNVLIGNLVAGRPPKGKENEYFLQTVREQANYVVECFPRASFNTFLVTGIREFSFRGGKQGLRVESLICPNRDDIRYLEDEKIVIPIGNENAKVAVVNTGGVAYTKSYPLQGIMENFQEAVRYVFENSEPFKAVIAGGLNSGIFIPRQLPVKSGRYNDFDGVAIPTLHRITPSQTVKRRRGASPVLGCMVLGVDFDKKGQFRSSTYVFYDLTAYFKDNDYLEDITIDRNLPEEAKKVLIRLRKSPARAGELSRAIRRAIKKTNNIETDPESEKLINGALSVEEAIEELKKKGYEIEFDEERKAYKLSRAYKKEFEPLDLSRLFHTTVRFLLSSDWHIGHEGERPDLVKRIFEIAEGKKVDAITCSGNLFEGADSYQGQHQHLSYHGADAQRDHLLEILPKSDIPLILIGSPVREHDRVFYIKAGHDIVDTFTKMAKLTGYKVEYLGGPHGTFTHKGITFDMQHPKGGLPYGQTYRIQRRLEMLVSSMDLITGAKASFIGHLHRAAFMLYKGMAGFLVPCLKDSPEDEYITALDKLAELGAWIVELSFDQSKNITKVELEYVPFEPDQKKMRHLNLDELQEKWANNKHKKNS